MPQLSRDFFLVASALERARRISGVFRLIEKVERAELAEAEARLQQFQVVHKELLASLGSDTALSGLFVDVLANRLRSVAVSIETQKQCRDARILALRTANLRLSGVARMLKRAETVDLLLRDTKELADLLDQMEMSKSQAPGKSSQ